MSLQRVLDEYGRWRSYDVTHADCMTALRNRDPNTNLRQIASDEEIDEAIRMLEDKGLVALEDLPRVLRLHPETPERKER